MKKSEFKDKLIRLLDAKVDGLDLNEKLITVKAQLVEIEKEIEYEETNKGKECAEDELRIVLSFSPTKANCVYLAKAFKRGYGSIEQIFRWASTSDKDITNKGRADDKFIHK